MDALSDVLKSVKLEGAVFIDACFAAPWCVRSSYGINNAEPQLPEGSHVVFFHLVTEGECLARLASGGEPIRARAGDLIVFPHDDQHLLGSDLDLLPVLSADTIRGDARDGAQLTKVRPGGDGPATSCVCGFVACSRTLLRPLLDALPRILRIPMGEGPAAALVRELVRTGVLESSAERPGSASIRTKLSELLFVEAMRRYAEGLPPEGRGWLAGLRDIHVGRALAQLHGDPARAWTVDALARQVGLSRSALAERFASLVGKSPIQYLTGWRLALAAQALRGEDTSILRVAERCGYESEAAFSRAFKREFGVAPSAWRSRRAN
jgi:AraC family transcriptional regulator, alkane utilization regulator